MTFDILTIHLLIMYIHPDYVYTSSQAIVCGEGMHDIHMHETTLMTFDILTFHLLIMYTHPDYVPTNCLWRGHARYSHARDYFDDL